MVCFVHHQTHPSLTRDHSIPIELEPSGAHYAYVHIHLAHNSLRRKDPIVPRRGTSFNIRTPLRCARYVRYEGAMTVIGINVVGLLMLLRCASATALTNLTC